MVPEPQSGHRNDRLGDERRSFDRPNLGVEETYDETAYLVPRRRDILPERRSVPETVRPVHRWGFHHQRTCWILHDPTEIGRLCGSSTSESTVVHYA